MTFTGNATTAGPYAAPKAETPHWLRIRTLILLRWGTIASQVVAMAIADFAYHLMIPYTICTLMIGSAALLNLAMTLAFPGSARLPERWNLASVLFDLAQLTVLLYLCGGLFNPCAALIIWPAIVSAAAFSKRSAACLLALTLLFVTLLTRYFIPLHDADGTPLSIGGVFRFGHWLAICMSVIFLSAYFRRIVNEMRSMAAALQATQMALSRERTLSDLGSMVAVTAHELGTPLATIRVTAGEMVDELEDMPDMQSDARLIREQAERCGNIMRGLHQTGKDDPQIGILPVPLLLEQAAAPHMNRGKTIRFSCKGGDRGHVPTISRSPELIHGLRNLIQNAVDFAASEVRIDCTWDRRSISLCIRDDGDGYAPSVLGRIGDPFLQARPVQGAERMVRAEYEGMGLGLFIAKTLLERAGAKLSFSNGTAPCPDTRSAGCDSAVPGRGAIVKVVWARQEIEHFATGGVTLFRKNATMSCNS